MTDINGRQLSTDEESRLMATFRHDCEQFAGEFYDMNRSDKFRANWPSQDRFATANWKTFSEATRHLYVDRLNDPHAPQKEKDMIADILILLSMKAVGQQTDDRLQLSPGTQQFEGDKRENASIVEKYGKGKNLRAALMQSSALH